MRHRVAGCLVGLAVVSAGLGLARLARAEPVDGRRVSYAGPTHGLTTASYASTTSLSPVPKEESSDGIFDPIRLGAFGGVGFPRPLTIEGFIKVEKVIGFGLEYSALPTLSIGGVDTGMYALAGDLRVFPLENGFFFGMSAGHQHLSAAMSPGSIPPELLAANPSVSADTWFINPRIGFLSTWSWGLTIGIDAGVQIPVASSVTNTIPSQLPISADASNVARTFGKSALPTVDLFRIGLLL
jgi:hypothetical protein